MATAPRNARRPPKAVVMRAEAASRTGELRYTQSLRAIMRSLHIAAMAGVEPHLPFLAGRRLDATRWGMGLEDRLSEFIKQLEAKVVPPFDTMAKTVQRQNMATQTELLGFRPSSAGINVTIDAARAENIRLMRRAGEKYADEILAVMDDPKTWDLTVEELMAVFDARGEAGMSRAALIARDQTYKLNAALTEKRQRNAGVESYRWSTCRDDRVRPTHRANEGAVFAWDHPPVVTGHPGHDPNCRCLALPIVSVEDAQTSREAQLEEFMKGLLV